MDTWVPKWEQLPRPPNGKGAKGAVDGGAMPASGSRYTKPFQANADRWGQLVQCVVDQPECPQDSRDILAEHARAIRDPKQLFPFFEEGWIPVCSSKTTHSNAELYLVQLKVSDPLYRQASVLIKYLVALGAAVEFGPGPRSQNERRTSTALKHVRSMHR